jgi:hypothetical protein
MAESPVAPSAITAKTKTVLIKDGVPAFVETSEPRALDAGELPGIVAWLCRGGPQRASRPPASTAWRCTVPTATCSTSS